MLVGPGRRLRVLKDSSRFWSHLVPVDVVQAVEQHLHDLLDLCQRELDVSVAQQPGQVVLTEIKHQVDASFVPVELSGLRTRTIIIIESENKSFLPDDGSGTNLWFCRSRSDSRHSRVLTAAGS